MRVRLLRLDRTALLPQDRWRDAHYWHVERGHLVSELVAGEWLPSKECPIVLPETDECAV